MRKPIVFVMILLISSLLFMDCAFPVQAEVIQEFAPETLAVSLVIDTSGSMYKSDPDNLRRTAADIFVDLLSPEDYLGVITFNTKVTEVLPIQQIGVASGRTSLKETISPAIKAGGDTNYTLALDAASRQLAGIQEENVRKVIIFITDGAPDPNSAKSENLEFMNQYMDSLWASVSNLKANELPVYAIGFSDGIRKDVLSQIADETGGSFTILPDSSTLASSFFHVLGELKNRKAFIDENVEIAGNYEFEFPMDEYTTQSTMVLLGQDDYEIEIRDPNGEVRTESASISKMDKYTIITINNKEEETDGKWSVTLIGNGTADIFGDRDLNLKSWLVSPAPSASVQLNAPVEIVVNVIGKIKDGISVLAVVKNVNGEEETIVLDNQGDTFQGVYNRTATSGEYSVEVEVLLNDEVITTKEESFSVGIVPGLKTSLYLKSEGYRVGESIPVSVWLSIENNRLSQGENLQIDSFILQLTDENQSAKEINLLDDGQKASQDTQANDGIWSVVINLQEETVSEASLMVTGTYKNEQFIVKEDLGTFKVKQPGSIQISIDQKEFEMVQGTTAFIPITMVNNSDFEETVWVETEDPVTQIADNKIVLQPNTTTTASVAISFPKEIVNDTYDLKLDFRPDYEKTTLNLTEAVLKIEVVSKLKYVIHRVEDFLNFIRSGISRQVIYAILLVGVGILFFVSIGRLLYRRLYLSAARIGGILEYRKKEEQPEQNWKLDFSVKKKDKIIISFDEENQSADYHIKGTGFRYDLIITSGLKRTHFPVIAGWRTLLRRSIPVKYKISSAAPGIIEKDNEIITSRILTDHDEFESGGYHFCYHMPDNKWNSRKTKGSNILEGKYEES